LLIESEGLAGELAVQIEADLDPEHAWRLSKDEIGLLWQGTRLGRTLSFRREPEAPVWRRLRVALFGLIPGAEGLL
jgi:hypothetical protein